MEAGPRSFESAVQEGKRHALAAIRRQHENPANPRDILDGHDAEHTENVVRRTGVILRTIQEAAPGRVADRDIGLGELIAAWHDVHMEYRAVPEQDGTFTKLIRKRVVPGELEKGHNERESAQLLDAFMALLENREAFTDDDRKLAHDAIAHTIPDFENGTAVQKELHDGSHEIARALALADLGDAGMDGFEAYKKQGDGFFREEHMDIMEALREGRALSSEDQEYFRSRMLAWSSFQPGFAEGRARRLEQELAGLPESAQEAVRKLFDKFDDTIRRSKDLAERRERLTFEELARDMGYIGV